MPHSYDVIVAGLGAMGSSTAAHLARRGKKVLGLERWIPGHQNASSHGDSRIIREMYFEHPMYVPLLQRAYELWAELGPVLNVYGGLMIGPEKGMLVTGTLRSASEHDLDHEVLTAAEVRKRYPAFDLRPDLVAIVDPRAGWLDPEQCNAAHLKAAAKDGRAAFRGTARVMVGKLQWGRSHHLESHVLRSAPRSLRWCVDAGRATGSRTPIRILVRRAQSIRL